MCLFILPWIIFYYSSTYKILDVVTYLDQLFFTILLFFAENHYTILKSNPIDLYILKVNG